MLFLYSMRTFETLAPKRFALVLICCATLSVSGQAQDAPMNAPEVMPVLNSCALNHGIMEHIIGKLEYPPAAHIAGIEGTVVVKFIINKTGQVNKTLVLKGPDELSKAAQQVVRSLPGFTPGLHKGKPVNVELVLPIRFALSDD